MEKVKTMTPLEASKILPMNAEKIRAGLRQGKFPFRNSNTRENRTLEIHNIWKKIFWVYRGGTNKWKEVGKISN